MLSIIPLFVTMVATAAPKGVTDLGVENCEIGEIYAFGTASCDVALSNSGDRPIRINGVRPANAGDSASPAEMVIAPHSQAYLKLKIDAGNDAGPSRHVVRFLTDESGRENRSAGADAFVLSVLDDVRPELDFGIVTSPGEPSRKSIELGSHDAPGFRIIRILEAPAWLDAKLDADGHAVSAVVKPQANWGIHADFIKVALNTPQQSQAWISAKADVRGDVVPATNPLDMSLIRIGNDNQFKIPLVNRFGKSFKIGRIELEGVRGTVATAPCEPIRDECAMLLLKVTEDQTGPIRGHVWVDFPALGQRLNIAVWGLLVPKDFQVRKVGPEELARNGSSEGVSSTGTKPIDLTRAVKEAVSATPVETPPGTGPLLKWTVANGQGIHGFQIFRADDEKGPFMLLNATTIPANAKTADSLNYKWRDTSAVAGRTYWYYIGTVRNDGSKQQLSGPQKVVAK